MSPGDLEIILSGLPRQLADPNVLVGLEHGDDAAVYRVSDDRALVFTVDVITPIVDDPRTFGRIVAANSLSDVFAMGGRPLMALNVACFSTTVPPEALREILAGASEASLAVGCPVLGGHTVKDSEIKFGLAVVGEVHPSRVVSNAGAKPGDTLILTKAVGTAALSTALKAGRFDEASPWFSALVDSMTRMNDVAARIAVQHGAHAMTDITGFGLAGHALEMAAASGVSMEIDFASVPQLPGAVDMLAEGYTCGGGKANGRFGEDKVEFAGELKPEERELVFDPQTSGGLLIAVDASSAAEVVDALRAAGVDIAARVGSVGKRSGRGLRVQ